VRRRDEPAQPPAVCEGRLLPPESERRQDLSWYPIDQRPSNPSWFTHFCTSSPLTVQCRQIINFVAKTVRAPAQLPEEAESPLQFDATALQWDSSYDAESVGAHFRWARLETAVRLAGDGPGSLLEIGVGSGRLLSALAAHGWTVNGIDAAPRMIELARQQVPVELGRLMVARAEALPFDAGAFDAVVAIGVLEYTDIRASLGEIARVLRPGGQAVIGFRAARSPAIAWRRHIMIPIARYAKRVLQFGRPLPRRRRSRLPLEQTRRLLEASGFSVEQEEHVGCAVLPDPIDRLAPKLAYWSTRTAERSPRLRRLFATQLVIRARKNVPGVSPTGEGA
jgi:ubiquinone/menaquinone biosynthesis C-methylase UbiE